MCPPDAPTRRALLTGIAAGFTAAAGCTGRDGPGTLANSTGSPPTGSPSSTAGDRPTATPRDPKPLPVSGAWPQRGVDPGHRGVTSAAGVPEAGETYWHLRRIRSGPAVLADGRLFHYAKLGEDPGGTPTLTRTRAEPAGTAHPVYGEPCLVARDAREGRIQWFEPLRGPAIRWPAAADGRVIVGVNGQLAAFDAADGSVAWDHDLGERTLGDPTITGDGVIVPLQGVVDGRSGETIEEPEVRAYGLADGTHRWTARAPKRANGLAVADGTVVVVSGGWDGTGVVLALSLAEGRERWRRDTAGDFFAAPVVAAGTAYVSNDDGLIRALALADGSERWRRTVETRPAGLAADATSVYVGADAVYALSADEGGVRWRATPGRDEEYLRTPAVGDGTVYVGSTGVDAHLFVLDAGDGTGRWSHTFPNTVVEGDMVKSGIEAQPAIADGAVYAYAADGLYAFGPA